MKRLHNRGTGVLQPVSDDVKQKLKELYEKGHTAATAYEILKVDLLLEFPDNYHEKAADRYYLPNLPFCFKQYYKLLNVKGGHSQVKDKWLKDLVKCCEQYNDDAHEGKASVFLKSGHFVVAVCTPIMQRTHSLIEQAKEVMFVGVVGHESMPNTTVYCLTTTSAAGDIPLGYIITDTQNKDVLIAGLTAYHAVMPAEAFYHQGFPTLIVTSDELKAPLATGFPNSVFLTGQSDVLKAVWSWLWDDKNGIDVFDRQELFQAFKASMLAIGEDELFENFQQSIVAQLTILQKYENFVTYMSSLWDKREEWASAYRILLFPCVSDTNTSVEIVQRIIGDNILKRAKCFNIPQMFDFLVTQYESYVQKCLANCTSWHFIRSLVRTVLPPTGGIDTVMILELQRSLYQVPCEIDSYTSYTVDLDIGICSCEEGSCGTVCQHQSAVIEKFKISDSFPLMSETISEVMCNAPVSEEQSVYVPENILADGILPAATDLAADLPLTTPTVTTGEIIEPLSTTTNEMVDFLLPMVSANEMTNLPQPVFFTANQPAEHHSPHQSDITEAENLAKQLYAKVCLCIRKNPRTFVPAMKNLRKNLEMNCVTDSAFSTAMQEFGMKKVTVQPGKRKRGCDTNQLIMYTLQPNCVLNPLLQSETSLMVLPPSSESIVSSPLILSLAPPIATTNMSASSTVAPAGPVFQSGTPLPMTSTEDSYLASSVPTQYKVTLPASLFLSVSPEGASSLEASVDLAGGPSNTLPSTELAPLDQTAILAQSSSASSIMNAPLFKMAALSVPTSITTAALSPPVEHSEKVISAVVRRPFELENHDYTLLEESLVKE